ncbi:multicopper oxidase family protein [Bosea sp. (in: a-proteobacteria)]|jgi:FtsP/CotA-like multicopper oxidase with cupredoxin domain|uniref:multicopper oxidase family protein n=1 Tax=Bosea sp. (in: a-proteobacteria) TaxID=1871050 RepID=UPI003569C434
MTLSRRGFVGASGFVVAAAGLVSGRAQAASIPEAASTKSPATQAPQVPKTGPDYQPVVTLNGWSLPWRMNGDWKEFHLVAEPVIREIAPGMKANLWGYNGQSPGPTIEAVEGDNVRIFVTNKLPENTAVHWHGQRLPNGMDGVGGLTQPHIPPGKTFVYEFQMRRSGTFMYHPHSDEMVQMAMGMMGFLVVHPKDPAFRRVDRDFVFLLNAFDIEAGSYVPKVNTMLDFNLWTWNSRAFPGIDPFVVAKNDKVRIRFGNLTMTNHPIHMHGYEFKVSSTDGGWVDEKAAWPEVSVDCAVGQMRSFDFVADEPGDWAIHCHKSHHTMNAMGHSVKTYIGVNKKDLVARIRQIAPGYMPMGSNGMGEMGSMEMQGPDNTLPMMTGYGQFGPIEMGGMFSVVKVREGLAKDDYKDPGWFKHPQGTVAYEYTGQKLAEAPRTSGPDSGIDSVDWQVKDPRKPTLAADGTPLPAKAGGHSNH